MGSVLIAPVPNLGVSDWRLMGHIVGYVDECMVVLICCIRAHGWIGTVIAAYAAAKGLCGDEDPISGGHAEVLYARGRDDRTDGVCACV